MNKKILYKFIFVLALIVFILCAIWIYKMLKPVDNHYTEYKHATSGKSSKNPEEPRDNPIDFKSLQKTNSDVYAWINIPDTNIDYPVVQASPDLDDNFYLDHDIHKNSLFEGMIYSQRLNSKDFSDSVTVLYGHNMKNGDMFATLHNFEDRKFFEQHNIIYIYTPGHILTYTVVSAYTYDDRHILNTFDFTKKKELKKYIKTITSPKSIVSNVRNNVKINTKSKILTLSTCTSDDSQRYLVQGVLTNDTITK